MRLHTKNELHGWRVKREFCDLFWLSFSPALDKLNKNVDLACHNLRKGLFSSFTIVAKPKLEWLASQHSQQQLLLSLAKLSTSWFAILLT